MRRCGTVCCRLLSTMMIFKTVFKLLQTTACHKNMGNLIAGEPRSSPRCSSHCCIPSSICSVWRCGPCCCPPTSSSLTSSWRPRPPSRACCGPPSYAVQMWSCSSMWWNTSSSAQCPAWTSWSQCWRRRHPSPSVSSSSWPT